jgi:hypothetical protein
MEGISYVKHHVVHNLKSRSAHENASVGGVLSVLDEDMGPRSRVVERGKDEIVSCLDEESLLIKSGQRSGPGSALGDRSQFTTEFCHQKGNKLIVHLLAWQEF